MAVFYTPLDGVKACEQMALKFEEFNRKSPVKLTVRMGLHTGNAFALTFNQKIDYFGNSVNYSARLEKHAGDSHLVISEDVLLDPMTSNWLDTAEVDVIAFTAPLKGISDEPLPLFRLTYGRAKKQVVRKQKKTQE